jgi:hypothetical protein
MLANNINDIAVKDVVRALFGAVIVAVTLLVIINYFVNDWQKTGLITTGMIVLIFSYGHVYSLLWAENISRFINLGRHIGLLLLYGVLGVFGVWMVIKKLRRTGDFVRLFNFIGIFLLIIPTYTILTAQFHTSGYKQVLIEEYQVGNLKSNGELPDIYYIILDGYGRSDVLDELYDYDNSDFLEFLQDHGFYVAELSNSNYNQTALSLASSLNGIYINTLSEILGIESNNRWVLREMIENNIVSKLLKESGYQLITFDSGYMLTDINVADYYWSPEDKGITRARLNGFETLLLESTIGRILIDFSSVLPDSIQTLMIGSEYQNHRQKILYTLNKLDDVPMMEGDYFVFAHILAPHPPFVFGSDGEELTPKRSFTLADGSHFGGNRKEYINGYRNQVTFINNQIKQVITRILEKSDSPPIIIIQGDHGPGAYLTWPSVEKSNLHERFGILNAYYVPEEARDMLYPSISPVNSFLMVLNLLFEGEIQLLNDESYYSTVKKPYEFVPVTNKIVSGN